MEKNSEGMGHILMGLSGFFPGAEFGIGFGPEIVIEL